MKKKNIQKFIDPKTGVTEEIDLNSTLVGILTAEEAKKTGFTDNPNRPHVPEEKFYSEESSGSEITAEEADRIFNEFLEELDYKEI